MQNKLLLAGLVIVVGFVTGVVARRARGAAPVAAAQSAANESSSPSVANDVAGPRTHRGSGQPIGALPGFYFQPEERELLAQNAHDYAQAEMHNTKEIDQLTCKHSLPNATDQLCARIWQANGYAIELFADARQRFMRGEIDQEGFQKLWHRSFLARQLEVESFLSWDEMHTLEGITPGGDVFLDLTAWNVHTGDVRLGDDLLARGGPNDHDRPRDKAPEIVTSADDYAKMVGWEAP